MSEQSTDLRETVRRRYAASAVKVTEGGSACCGPQPVEVDDNFGSALYAADERAALPAEAVAASLGCGNPTAVAELREGESVLDLGSGGGIDVLLSARRVGPTGKAYGLDMTEEMSPWPWPTRRRRAPPTSSSSRAPSRRFRSPPTPSTS